MRVEESTALNEEEINMLVNTQHPPSILTTVMAPHVVAAWLDEEEHDAT